MGCVCVYTWDVTGTVTVEVLSMTGEEAVRTYGYQPCKRIIHAYTTDTPIKHGLDRIWCCNAQRVECRWHRPVFIRAA